MNKKIILSLSLLSISSLFLASCHKPYSISTFDCPITFDDSKEYEIEFWSKNDGNIKQANIYTKTIEEFEKIYPNIKVSNRVYTSYDTIYKDVITNISSETPPNVCVSYPDHVATYLENENIVVPLDGLMANSSYGLDGSDLLYKPIGSSNIIDKFLNEGTIDRYHYTLPFVRSSEALYINETYLKMIIDGGYLSLDDYASYGITSYNSNGIPDIPTWDWLWACCDACIEAKKNGIPSYSKNDPTFYPFIYKSSDNWMIQEFMQLGYDYTSYDVFTKEGKATLFNDNTKDFLIDLSKKAKLREVLGNVKTGLYSTFDVTTYPANMFNQWEVLFCTDSTAGATWMGSNAELVEQAYSQYNPDSFETAVRVIPQHDINNEKMISQGPSLCIFNDSDPDIVVASWIFAQYLLTDSVQEEYSSTEGYAPVTKSAISSVEYQKYLLNEDNSNYQVKIDATKLVIDNIDNTFTTPVFKKSADIRNASKYLITAVTGSFNSPNKYTTYDEIDKLFQKAIVNNELETNIGTISNNYYIGGIIIISSIVVVWICIGIYVFFDYKKKKRK